MKPSFLRGILGPVLVVAALSALAEPVTISRDSPLYSEARSGSSVVAQLKQGSPGETVGKQGAWINLKTAGGTGWLLSTNITYGEASASTASASTGGFNPFARRAQASNTVGIRGFDKETINSALSGGAVSTAQLALLDGYKVEKPDGAAFASSKSLQASKVPY